MSVNPAIIYFDRHSLDFYGSNKTEVVLHLDIPENVVNNLEIIDKDQLRILIKAFIDFHKILPTNTILLLSQNTYFEKILPSNPEEAFLLEKQKYLDNVPFENVSSKTYKYETKSIIIATNKDLYLGIKMAFDQLGFNLDIVIPEFILKKYIEVKEKIDMQVLKTALEKFDYFKQDNLLDEVKNIPSKPQNKKNLPSTGTKSSFLTILLPVLIILISVLVSLIIYSSNQNTKSTKNPNISPMINKQSQ